MDTAEPPAAVTSDVDAQRERLDDKLVFVMAS